MTTATYRCVRADDPGPSPILKAGVSDRLYRTMSHSTRILLMTGGLFAACASQPTRPSSPEATALAHVPAPAREPPVSATEPDPQPEAEAAEEAPVPRAGSLPSDCEPATRPCAPPSDFVGRLCRGKYPGVALLMFKKGTPWQRVYVNQREVNTLNTVGGPVGDTKLGFAEELLLLRKRGGAHEGIQVSGSTSYDVLRWDGSCATLVDGEFVPYQPGLPQHAPIAWRFLDAPLQEALLGNDRVRQAREAERKECRGRSTGGGESCLHASEVLTRTVVAAVRRGMSLPVPEKLP